MLCYCSGLTRSNLSSLKSYMSLKRFFKPLNSNGDKDVAEHITVSKKSRISEECNHVLETSNGRTTEISTSNSSLTVSNGFTHEIKTTTVVTIESDSSSSWLPDLIVDENWRSKLRAEFGKQYFKSIEKFLDVQYAKGKKIFPPKNLIFNAFNVTPLHRVKVVILGQDPYHDDGQAHGLSFSVQKGTKPPPSLKNIYKELATNFDNFKPPDHGCLEKWAKSGVLLLNATLTVEAHNANSHAAIGWQTFTDSAIKIVNKECTGVVFLLWGGFAHKKEKSIDVKKHSIIKTAHPSPLSCKKFFGCRCFARVNEILVEKYGKTPIDWSLH